MNDDHAQGAPERIWLQDAGDYSRAKAAGDDLTWCDQPVDEKDSPYILATALAASPEGRALIDGTLAALQDPLVVHLNMVAGKIAKPLPSQLVHIYGEDVILSAFAALARAEDAVAAVALAVEQAIQIALRRASSHTGGLSAGSGRSDSREAWLRSEECKGLAWEIRALAPDAGIKALAELRAERDDLSKRLFNEGEAHVAVQAERDALRVRLAAAEAQVGAAKKAAQDYCWQRYKGRDPLNLSSPAVFTSHEWQKIGEAIDAAIAAAGAEG